jgi:hypothetical protein
MFSCIGKYCTVIGLAQFFGGAPPVLFQEKRIKN